MLIVQQEGFRELITALRTVEAELYGAVKDGLHDAGEVVRNEAAAKFRKYDARTAAGFQTRVRPSAGSSVFIGQRLRKTTGLHPEWGDLQMRKALIPARSEKLDEAADIVEAKVSGLLRSHGF